MRGKLRSSGADEDEVDGIDAKEKFGVAQGADSSHIEAVLRENAADEHAEVGGRIKDEQTAGAFSGDIGGRRGLLKEGLDGDLFGRVAAKDVGEVRDSEQVGDEWLRRGEADGSATLAEAAGVTHEEAEAGTVHAVELGEVQDDAGEFQFGLVKGGFQNEAVVARHEAALAVDDVDFPAKARFQGERHGSSFCAAISGER